MIYIPAGSNADGIVQRREPELKCRHLRNSCSPGD